MRSVSISIVLTILSIIVIYGSMMILSRGLCPEYVCKKNISRVPEDATYGTNTNTEVLTNTDTVLGVLKCDKDGKSCVIVPPEHCDNEQCPTHKPKE